MTRLLVLGARGFLGRHVVEAALAHPAVSQVLAPTRSELDLGQGAEDLADRLAALAPDAVVLATGRLDGSPAELLDAHAGSLTRLVDAAQRLRRPPRLVRLGSAGEYGPVTFGSSVDEEHRTSPATAYGASHLAATHLLRVAVLQGRLTGTTLRVFNPVGAGAHSPTLPGQVAERIRCALARGSAEIVTGPLTTWRDLVDAHDVGEAAVLAALAPRSLPPVVNIGTGNAVSARELVTCLAGIAGWDGTVSETLPAPDRSAGVGWMQADVTLAGRTLGWHPRRVLVDSLQDLWRQVGPRTPSLLTEEAS